MEINERLVNTYKNQGYENLLHNPSLYKDLVTKRLNRFILPNVSTQELTVIDALDNYIVKKISDSPDYINNTEVITYRNCLFDIFKEKPEIAIDSILFKQKISKYIFNKEQQSQIEEYRFQVAIRAHDNLLDIIDDKFASEEDLRELVKFAISEIPNPKMKNLVDILYQRFLNNPYNCQNIIAQEFILKYTAYLASKNLKIPPVSLYISNYDLKGENIAEDEHGCSYGNSSIININRRALKNEQKIKGIPSIIYFMSVASHETRHSKQAYDMANNLFTNEALEYSKYSLFSKVLSTDQFNEYYQNYEYTEIESDADIYGWEFVAKLLEKYAPERLKLITKTTTKGLLHDYKKNFS